MSSVAIPETDKFSVTISDEVYHLNEIPAATQKLVAAAREGILNTIQLDDFLSKLHLVGQLLFVAYNGVATQPLLRGDISTLQSNYMRLCGDSETTMFSFQESCGSMLRHLTRLFNYLLNGEEDTALIYLKQMADVAGQMAAAADNLAKKFSSLFEQAQTALAGAETAKGTEEEKKRALEKDKKDFEAKLEGAKKLKEEIEKSKAELQRLYQEAQQKAEKAEDRAFALAIVGAIFTAVGAGLGAYAGAQTGGAVPKRLDSAPSADAPKQDDPKPATTKERIEAEAALTHAKGEVEAAEAQLKEANAKAKEAKDRLGAVRKESEKASAKDEEKNQSVSREAEEKAKKADEAVKLAEKNLEEARQQAAKAEEKSKLLKGVSKGLTQGGQAAENAGQGYAEIAAAYNREKQDLFNKLLEEGRNEREALASIAEYAKRMEGIGGLVKFADLVIEALHQALGALKEIVVILETASELWTRMAMHCKSVASESGEIRQRIEIWKSKPNRVELYLGDSIFKEDAVRHYCNWKALELVSREYNIAVGKVKKEVQANVRTNLTTEEMLKKSVEEGKKLLAQTNQEMNKLDVELKNIERETQSLTPAGA